MPKRSNLFKAKKIFEWKKKIGGLNPITKGRKFVLVPHGIWPPRGMEVPSFFSFLLIFRSLLTAHPPLSIFFFVLIHFQVPSRDHFHCELHIKTGWWIRWLIDSSLSPGNEIFVCSTLAPVFFIEKCTKEPFAKYFILPFFQRGSYQYQILAMKLNDFSCFFLRKLSNYLYPGIYFLISDIREIIDEIVSRYSN